MLFLSNLQQPIQERCIKIRLNSIKEITERKPSSYMQMKNIISYLSVLFTLFFFSNCSKDDDQNQAIILVQQNIFYQEFDVDTTNFDNDTICYDINGDLKLDLQLTKHINIGTSDVQYSGTIESKDDSIRFCYIRTEPNWTMLDLGDEIYSSNIYNWQSFVVYSGNTPYFSAQHYWVDGIFTDYIGFQLIKENNKYYGWLRLKHFRVAEIGINRTPDNSIIVGQTK